MCTVLGLLNRSFHHKKRLQNRARFTTASVSVSKLHTCFNRISVETESISKLYPWLVTTSVSKLMSVSTCQKCIKVESVT
uniref:Uncharacterized protein n=1 Tax=Pararge aegeria TaxID=116150 RepID=S4NMQ7_9NEOP